MKKATKKIKISCVGGNAVDVSGSMTLIEFGQTKVLIEAGLYQSSDAKKDYLINARQLPFKPSDINYIIIGHIHADHTLLLPRLFSLGCRATVIVPKYTTRFLHHLLTDGAKICQRDSIHLSKIYGKAYPALYSEEDVENVINHIEEYELEKNVQIDKHIQVEFIPSGHIIQSAQISLTINFANCVKHLLFTSDLGNIAFPKYYISKFQEAKKQYDIVFGESTYGLVDKKLTRKHRRNDLANLKFIIDESIKNNGKVIIPIFSLDRSQNIATMIYDIYKDDVNFKAKVIIDSPLAYKLTNEYVKTLNGDDLEKLQALLNWENFSFVSKYENHLSLLESSEPMVILAAPGFANLGRSQALIEACVSKAENAIVFCGYAPENSIAGRLKKQNITITINKKQYKIKSKILIMETFSSHMQKADLLNYYSSLNCNTLVLVHGSKEAKESLSNDLTSLLEKNSKNTKVVSADKNSCFYI